jgi:hypothetical protein
MAFVSVGAAGHARTDGAQDQAAPKETTWAGKISDAHCGAGKHSMGTAEECVTACAKNGGYVFVGDKDKVFKIANQKFADLAKFAGKDVELTGTAKDDTITVTKVAAKK